MTDNNKDFNFYGEGTEDNRPAEIHGITDKLTMFTYTGMAYPCLIIKESFSCPKHRMLVISNMVKTKTLDKDINLYYSQGGELFKMGMLGGQQVKVAIDLIGEEFLEGFLSDNEKLEGDKLFVLFS